MRLLQRGWQIPSLKKANGQNGQYSTAVFDLTPTLASPICSTLFGDRGIAYLSLLIACWVPVSNVIATVGLVHASRLSGTENRGKRKNFLVAVFSNPLILATLLGLVCNTFSIELPKLLEDVLKPLGQSSLALGLICIGAGLKINDLKRYLQMMIIGSLQRLMVVPAVALTFAIVFQLLPLESCVLLLFAALPTAQSCYVMTASMAETLQQSPI